MGNITDMILNYFNPHSLQNIPYRFQNHTAFVLYEATILNTV